ncbi:hypothetical protein DF113_32550 [Burkholderia stagnalis]|nr:hypothetical protein DF113_32550 [Burkholderia stagnalis]
MRTKTLEEAMADQHATGRMSLHAKDQLLARVATPLEAARYMAMEWHDTGLANFINDALSESAAHKAWRDAMPPRTPAAIAKYQKEFPHYDAAAVDAEIAACNVSMPVDQFLFHGGLWMGGANGDFTTTLPLSTTLCPQVALTEALFNGKAHNAGAIHLMVLRVASLSPKAFVFRRNGTNLGHENEVLFASGVHLVERSRSLVCNNYPATSGQVNAPTNLIPVYVFEIDLL